MAIFISDYIAATCFSPCSSIVFICLSKAFPNGEYVHFVCSVIFVDWIVIYLRR